MSSTLRLFIAPVAAFVLAGLLPQIQARAQAPTVTDTNLFDDLHGFGSGTTGGLGGDLYVVTRTDDANEPGTLRYGVESLTGPTWIVFDPAVFPPTQDTELELEGSISLRDNLTLDGRGAHVSLVKYYEWDDALWTEIIRKVRNEQGEVIELIPTNRWECGPVASPARKMEGLLQIQSDTNVVITHLEFEQRYLGSVPLPDPLRPNPILDKQCFKDTIAIYNAKGQQDTHAYDDIWINQSELRNCGDECIGISRSSNNQRAHLTISNTQFVDAYKAVLIGGNNSLPGQIVATLYGNRFINNKQRQPRIQNANVHLYNNVWEAWDGHGISVFSGTRVMAHDNVFRATIDVADPWYRDPDSTNAYIWAQDNHLQGVENPSQYISSNFPACVQDGGPWYYDCSAPSIDIGGMAYGPAITTLRAMSGWRDTVNDAY